MAPVRCGVLSIVGGALYDLLGVVYFPCLVFRVACTLETLV